MQEKNDSIEHLYRDLRKYRLKQGENGQAFSNSFWCIGEHDLVTIEKQMGLTIPAQLRRFYLEVGYGNMELSRSGVGQNTYYNYFLDLPRLAMFWSREEVSIQQHPDLIDKDELVFFDMGSYCYLVVRPYSSNPNAVYYPYDNVPLAQTFNEFVLNLYDDTTFYLE